MNQASITTVKGIGEKMGALFCKLGVETVEDLLHYYPRAYDALEEPIALGDLVEGTVVAVEGTLPATAELVSFQNRNMVVAGLREGKKNLQLVWYHMPFLKHTLKAGIHLVFRGKIVKKRGRLIMEQPEIFQPDAYRSQMNSLFPIYGQTRGLGNKAIAKAAKQALELRQMERDYLPLDLRAKYQLAEYNFALEHIHFPMDKTDLLFARKRLVFDEFFLFILSVRRLKGQRKNKNSSYQVTLREEAIRLKEKLPYQLTDAQEKVLSEVYRDMSGGLVMNRLIQGDVGSGKTIIAVLSLLQVALNGYQGALMVPTEVLAKQHFQFITELFRQHGIDKTPVLLTGSMTAKEKRETYALIENHQADIIVGTHALIQEKVVYHRLALVVTDEQHRFGVGQRETLGKKGEEPHILVMSATPIPRTLAIIIYGDLDISIIDQLPSNRQPIKNCVVGIDYRKTAYRFIEKEVMAGRQAYVICPMVEASEMIEAENVLDYTKKLQKELSPSIRTAYLHGKMKPREKNELMEQFAAGEIQVLVSTTVIEVGINVPNATVMMIENAERFGLAQLHQLRGRVGRGKHQSYCIMVNSSSQDETRERLDILNHSNDGFFIASEDLRLRGPGDLFGMRQSGEMEFRLADIFTDANLLKTVSEEVDLLLETDPMLTQEDHRDLDLWFKGYMEQRYENLNL